MCQKDERQEILQEGRSPCWYYSGSRQFLDIKIFFSGLFIFVRVVSETPRSLFLHPCYYR